MAEKLTSRPVGRPTEYRPEFAEMMIEYFKKPAWDVVADGKIIKGYFPTMAGFAAHIGTTRMTLWSWAAAVSQDGTPKYPEFLYTYERAKDYQEDYFIKGYLAGKYRNPAIGAMIAKNLFNWRDKQKLEQTVTAFVEPVPKVALDFSDIVSAIKASS
jgi:hypothetical protein